MMQSIDNQTALTLNDGTVLSSLPSDGGGFSGGGFVRDIIAAPLPAYVNDTPPADPLLVKDIPVKNPIAIDIPILPPAPVDPVGVSAGTFVDDTTPAPATPVHLGGALLPSNPVGEKDPLQNAVNTVAPPVAAVTGVSKNFNPIIGVLGIILVVLVARKLLSE